ncbi:MAG TPA: creatininase family protein [Bryobacteraceae bacterium]|nr:creatininase family protein [Bryobacteraceae bacterium]
MRLIVIAALAAACSSAQTLSANWEELTGPDFVKAIQQAKGVCLLPFGIIEKHGPTGPMGTDLLNVRYATFEAVKQEYAIVFPEYYFGQIFEAKHQPGTVAYSTHLQLELLQETTNEMARNGCSKVVIISGHGGNTNLIQFFAQTQLETPKDWVLYAIMNGAQGGAGVPGPSKPGADGHAGEAEMSNVMAHRPDLVHPDRAPQESGADLKRLDLPIGVYTGIWWYASFPNHYQGDAAGANAARGTALMQARTNGIANAIRAIKADTAGPRLQKEFFEASKHPIDTKQ